MTRLLLRRRPGNNLEKRYGPKEGQRRGRKERRDHSSALKMEEGAVSQGMEEALWKLLRARI